ncbi:hypothetical protein BC939DRAFT_287984 [Gamsiella multidivaricata]|uniref:uncharacterized protein n=1 Tax=Gamsiella multidivaricata TaxID=101098 RepID=UPI00221F0CBD|nr:uncharacterized protein BC939DRAFT_287984 [Gamsiella multidivaricata]KAI7818640.1 hypothetical protein BC939DRAFT_287984 [Gamsiella multidivaricata]
MFVLSTNRNASNPTACALDLLALLIKPALCPNTTPQTPPLFMCPKEKAGYGSIILQEDSCWIHFIVVGSLDAFIGQVTKALSGKDLLPHFIVSRRNGFLRKACVRPMLMWKLEFSELPCLSPIVSVSAQMTFDLSHSMLLIEYWT